MKTLKGHWFDTDKTTVAIPREGNPDVGYRELVRFDPLMGNWYYLAEVLEINDDYLIIEVGRWLNNETRSQWED